VFALELRSTKGDFLDDLARIGIVRLIDATDQDIGQRDLVIWGIGILTRSAPETEHACRDVFACRDKLDQVRAGAIDVLEHGHRAASHSAGATATACYAAIV